MACNLDCSTSEERLEDVCKVELAKISKRVAEVHFEQEAMPGWSFMKGGNILQIPEPRTREEFLQYCCQLTLDPNTANRELRLSDGNRVVQRK
ncbi:hypothetical protein MATL_G00032990 [Megalops atlanticus]|uniref:SPRY-associated domain-containing protein n=1 Tax=Megalops atlanticus TaxID=7932 RepID=A0A9D3QJ23_MEGAT|nr:hypothetical protein MATL_G00032990 [Megalops atlanticus]